MRSRMIDAAGGLRVHVAVLETGDAVTDCLTRLARRAAHGGPGTAIGAFESATLAFFDRDSNRCEEIPVHERAEVLSLAGDIALDEHGGPKLHLRTVPGRRGGATVGGHLLDARVRPTLEVIINQPPAHLQRVHDPASGLALIRP